MMCRVLMLSRSGYYAWRKRPQSHRAQRRERVGVAVEQTFVDYRKRYGAPRLFEELNARGIRCSLNHMAELLKERGLRARNGKGFRYRPLTESRTNVSENLLNRQFEAAEPNQKWVSDITYIKVNHQWLYLAVVLDLFSRKVVGWSLANHMRERLILDAFTHAVSQRNLKEDALIHSDRGVQYRGNEYLAALISEGVRSSMSRKGNCWEREACPEGCNAVVESFLQSI